MAGRGRPRLYQVDSNGGPLPTTPPVPGDHRSWLRIGWPGGANVGFQSTSPIAGPTTMPGAIAWAAAAVAAAFVEVRYLLLAARSGYPLPAFARRQYCMKPSRPSNSPSTQSVRALVLGGSAYQPHPSILSNTIPQRINVHRPTLRFGFVVTRHPADVTAIGPPSWLWRKAKGSQQSPGRLCCRNGPDQRLTHPRAVELSARSGPETEQSASLATTVVFPPPPVGAERSAIDPAPSRSSRAAKLRSGASFLEEFSVWSGSSCGRLVFLRRFRSPLNQGNTRLVRAWCRHHESPAHLHPLLIGGASADPRPCVRAYQRHR